MEKRAEGQNLERLKKMEPTPYFNQSDLFYNKVKYKKSMLKKCSWGWSTLYFNFKIDEFLENSNLKNLIIKHMFQEEKNKPTKQWKQQEFSKEYF